MAWIKRLLFWRRDDDEEESAGDDTAESERPPPTEEDAYEPRGEQAEILARVRRDAEADAIRHAEDMLDRDFPIVTEAEGIAETRLAALKTAYAERRGTITGRIRSLEGAVTETAGRLQTTEDALRAEGVPAAQIGLPPLRAKPAIAERVGIGLGAAALVALLVKLLDLQGPVALAIAGVAVLALTLALALQPGASLEEPGIAGLREVREQRAGELAELQDELRRSHNSLSELENRTFSTAELEVEFAGRLVGVYESAVFSSLPVGVLAEGRELKQQRRPAVDLPSWTSGLAGAE
jgi:hypothetical protein